MGVLSWILFGLVAGGIAKLVMPGKDPGGCLVTSLIGIVGALLGGFIATTLFDLPSVTGFNLRSLVTAILGSIALLLVYRLVVRPRR